MAVAGIRFCRCQWLDNRRVRRCAEEGVLFRAGVAIPGVPNLHSHAFQRAMAEAERVSHRRSTG